jgi:hypothetical protein
MSFGFQEEPLIDGQPLISNAILTALTSPGQRIVFFAAAANDGGNQPMRFPASNPTVIAVRSSDTLGHGAGFNPPREITKLDGIMTQGQHVPGVGLRQKPGLDTKVYMSGTSVSTPIAAGIAAMVQQYIRLKRADLYAQLGESAIGPNSGRIDRFFTVEGMRHLLVKMSSKVSEGWHYLPGSGFLTNNPYPQAQLADLVSWSSMKP